MSSDQTGFNFHEDIGDDVEVHDTSNPDALFVTTRSKIELALKEYEEGIRAKYKWTTPVTLGITVLSVLFVTDFRAVLGLSAPYWRAVFSILFLLSVLWIVKTVLKYIQMKDRTDLEYVIEKLKSDE